MIPTFSSPETAVMWKFLEEKDLSSFTTTDCKGAFNSQILKIFGNPEEIGAKLMRSALLRVDWEQIEDIIKKRQTGQSVELVKKEE